MSKNPPPSSMDQSDEEEYIDIEVSSCSFFSSCPNSSPQNRKFEFQMASISNYSKETTTSPADELFYRGRLLPLHQKILQTELFEDEEDDSFCINLLITPIGSPSQTCRLSFELNPNNHKISPKKLWSKIIKHSSINQKFKSSRKFFKSLFSKSSCINSNCCSSKDMKVSKKKTPLKNTTNGTSCAIINNIRSLSSRSFTAAEIKWQQKSRHGSSRSFSSSTSSSTGDSFSSSNWSFNSNNEFNFLKRSSSDIEGSIEAAVAHCKKSQELVKEMSCDLRN